ncbi:HAD family hydrolase [Pseudorhodoferax sp.]|uniref:HAD family hydrolase n=1 Tax=Pseudorhodoferax sp. TaxID=1993553 RepID=UPI0039E680C5
MRTEALIFDMDGTIVDSLPFHERSWVHFCRHHGLALDAADIMARTNGRTGVECMAEVFGRALPPAEAQALVRQKEAIYRALFAADFREIAGFSAFAAAAAARGLKLGMGTAGDRDNIDFVLGRLAWRQRPQAVVGGDEGLSGKPTPAIFLEVARRLGVAPAHCIVFEDAPFGIEAARRAGMRAVAVCSTHAPEELAGPHVVAAVRDYQELAHSKFLEMLDVAHA